MKNKYRFYSFIYLISLSLLLYISYLYNSYRHDIYLQERLKGTISSLKLLLPVEDYNYMVFGEDKKDEDIQKNMEVFSQELELEGIFVFREQFDNIYINSFGLELETSEVIDVFNKHKWKFLDSAMDMEELSFEAKYRGKSSFFYLYPIMDDKGRSYLLCLIVDKFSWLQKFAISTMYWIAEGVLLFIMFLCFRRIYKNYKVILALKELEVSEVRRKKRQLVKKRNYYENKAKLDPLTKLYNREYIIEYLREAIANYESIPVCTMYVDLDFFKEVNDTWGHHFGDKVLVGVAEVLRNSLRSNDAVGRLGGDEFILVLTNLNRDKMERIGKRIVKDIEDMVFYTDHGAEVKITCSAGILSYSGEPLDDFLKKVDQLLYMAKEERNKLVADFDRY